MMNDRTITTAIQSSNTEALLDAYRRYTGNNTQVSDDLFAFISTPTPLREEFLANYCTCTYVAIDNTVVPNYIAL